LMVSRSWGFDVPAGTLNVHITVCIVHLLWNRGADC
jgi:hypothetical protein